MTELLLVQTITFNMEEHFLAAATADADEWVLLSSIGQLFRYKAGDLTGTPVGRIRPDQGMQYSDGGFDLKAEIAICLLDGIVVVVNTFKRHGYVYRPGKDGPRVHLWRGEYHADITPFPIALYRDENGVPHLIHGTDWNELHVLNLDTLQELTAAKSLIEEGAEEYHLALLASHPDINENNIPWPRPFDYFYGDLLLSPDQTRFLSKGWHWGSSDACYSFDIADFIRNPRLKRQDVGAWDHSSRGICWVDDATIAVLYSPWQEGDEGSTAATPFEIRYYTYDGATWEQSKELPLADYRQLDSELVYDPEQNVFVAFTLHKEGFTVLSATGQTLFSDPSLVVKAYNAGKGLFTTLQDQTVANYRLRVHAAEEEPVTMPGAGGDR